MTLNYWADDTRVRKDLKLLSICNSKTTLICANRPIVTFFSTFSFSSSTYRRQDVRRKSEHIQDDLEGTFKYINLIIQCLSSNLLPGKRDTLHAVEWKCGIQVRNDVILWKGTTRARNDVALCIINGQVWNHLKLSCHSAKIKRRSVATMKKTEPSKS